MSFRALKSVLFGRLELVSFRALGSMLFVTFESGKPESVLFVVFKSDQF